MSKLKFAHISDIHLGSWRDEFLYELSFKTFEKTIKKIKEKEVDFLIICGDIFDIPLPDLKIVEKFVKIINEINCPIYVIGGSHDFSNLNKSFLNLLNSTKTITLLKNPKKINEKQYELRFTKNEKLKLNISGIFGRKNSIEKKVYENLVSKDLDKNYFNLFLFHIGVNEMLNQSIGISKNLLPKNFDFYAGGHIHINKTIENKISYSGCLFPNNFIEFIEQKPTFNFCEFDFETRQTQIEKIEVEIYEKIYLELNFENLNSIECQKKIQTEIDKNDFENKIVLLKIFGKIEGKIAEININKYREIMLQKGANCVLKNTYNLSSKANELKIDLKKLENLDDTIKEISREYIENDFESKFDKIKKILAVDFTKQEEERNKDYEKRVNEIFRKIL